LASWRRFLPGTNEHFVMGCRLHAVPLIEPPFGHVLHPQTIEDCRYMPEQGFVEGTIRTALSPGTPGQRIGFRVVSRQAARYAEIQGSEPGPRALLSFRRSRRSRLLSVNPAMLSNPLNPMKSRPQDFPLRDPDSRTTHAHALECPALKNIPILNLLEDPRRSRRDPSRRAPKRGHRDRRGLGRT
jgi:hypothetical protein